MALAVLAAGLSWQLLGRKVPSLGSRSDADASLAFVGSDTCASCHQKEAELWRTSHHKLAMDHATEKSVLGDFSGVTFTCVVAEIMQELKNGRPFLTKDPKLLLNDNYAGKPEGIHLMVGRRPYAAFGNSIGDRQMLEYTKAGRRAVRDARTARRCNARVCYGPALGLPDTKVGTFSQALYDEPKKQGWVVISMKNDWKRIFSFEQWARCSVQGEKAWS